LLPLRLRITSRTEDRMEYKVGIEAESRLLDCL
jgi:hypothetical protein